MTLNAGEIGPLVVAILAFLGAATAYLKAHTSTTKTAAVAKQLSDHLASGQEPSKTT